MPWGVVYVPGDGGVMQVPKVGVRVPGMGVRVPGGGVDTGAGGASLCQHLPCLQLPVNTFIRS